MVRDSGLDAVIVRPSVVIGDSRSGEIRQAQAVHTLAEYLIRGQLPFLPAHPGSYLDTVPQDMVAQGVRAVLEGGLRKGEFWLTAGAHSRMSSFRVTAAGNEVAARGVRVPVDWESSRRRPAAVLRPLRARLAGACWALAVTKQATATGH